MFYAPTINVLDVSTFKILYTSTYGRKNRKENTKKENNRHAIHRTAKSTQWKSLILLANLCRKFYQCAKNWLCSRTCHTPSMWMRQMPNEGNVLINRVDQTWTWDISLINNFHIRACFCFCFLCIIFFLSTWYISVDMQHKVWSWLFVCVCVCVCVCRLCDSTYMFVFVYL